MKFIDIPVKKTLFSAGLNQFGQSPLRFFGAEQNDRAMTFGESGVPSNFIKDGDMIVRLNVINGYLQSNGFVTGTTGWRIDSDGNVEFESGYFRGDITGSTGSFSGSISIGSGNNIFKADANGIYLGNAAFASAPFSVSMAGALKATSATITGALTTGAGSSIGGTYIDSLNANKINVGTLTGFTVQTATTGYRAVMTSANGYQLYNGATWQASLRADSAAAMVLNSVGNIYLQKSGAQMMHVTGDSLDIPSGYTISWASGTQISNTGAECRIDRQLRVNGNVYPAGDNEHTCGASDNRWSGGWFEDISVDDATINSQIVPDANGGANCGTTDRRWSEVYTNGCTGCAYKEWNLLDEKQKKEHKKTEKVLEFEQGMVLAWKEGKLVPCHKNNCDCVMAVADKDGTPIVLGAEKIWVTGIIKEGDMLVTSMAWGRAKAEENPKRGAVIGQALESKDTEGNGTIKAMIQKF